MRWPRARFTIRWMMIAIAIVAVAFTWGEMVHRRKARWLRLAAYHQVQSEIWCDKAFEGVTCLFGMPAFVSRREVIEWHTNAFGVEAGLALKWSLEHRGLWWAYELAACSWVALALDPREPGSAH
jgi:hypothetical protein